MQEHVYVCRMCTSTFICVLYVHECICVCDLCAQVHALACACHMYTRTRIISSVHKFEMYMVTRVITVKLHAA